MTEFSGLLSNNSNMIFMTLFRQSRTVLRFGFNLGCNAPSQEGVYGMCNRRVAYGKQANIL